MIKLLKKKITTKGLFFIWITTIIIFIFQIFLLRLSPLNFDLSSSFLKDFFFLVFGFNILTGSSVFILMIISFINNKFIIRKENDPKKNKEKQKEKFKNKKIFIFISFVFFILIFILFIIWSNYPAQKNEEFSRLLITFLISSISYSSFLFYVLTLKEKKYQKEPVNLNYLVGALVVNGVLSIFLALLFFFISLPFLNFNDELENLKINFLRIIIVFAVLTLITSIAFFYKKKFRGIAVFLIFYLIIGILINFLINSENLNTDNLNSNKVVFLKDRTNCNKDETLIRIKNCTMLVLRDDNGHGTGFVFKPGFLVTNRHVIEGAKKIYIWYEKQREVELWNYSDDADIALLKLPDDIRVAPCTWFDSSKLKIAEELYAIGWPNTPEGDSTVTKGILSRVNKYEDGSEDLQTDAPINPGNSGGPLVNECGVVGINTMRVEWSQENSPRIIEGMGFALSSNFIFSKIDSLISDKNPKKQIPPAKKNLTNDFYKQPQENFYDLDIEYIKNYLNDLYEVKASWEQARGEVDEKKLNNLIDSFNRQIDFCRHLINKLSDGKKPSADDINLWNAVVKMSYESSSLSKELNRELNLR